MDLDSWLRNNYMETIEFARLVGCHRKTIYFAKKGKAISSKIAAKIYELTNEQVDLKIRNVGRAYEDRYSDYDRSSLRGEKA